MRDQTELDTSCSGFLDKCQYVEGKFLKGLSVRRHDKLTLVTYTRYWLQDKHGFMHGHGQLRHS